MTGERSFRGAEGGLIDRERPLSFTFDGREMTGYAGDTLASALLANGVRLVGRSFKYHRPRGIFAAGSNEPNALVELGTGARRTPNIPATMAELREGLAAASQNRWPSLTFDLMAVNDLLAPFMPAGFYYKTFMWPRALWERLYEPQIRKAAGLGRPAMAPDPDRYERGTLHCDILVVGGGPAGLSAALAAGRTGARVVLCDEDFRLGGRLLADDVRLDGRPGHAWAESVAGELAGLDNVRLMRRTTVFGYYDHNTLGAVEKVADYREDRAADVPRERLWHIEAHRVVLATGANERPIAFTNNDLPGVMLGSAARAYVNRFAVRPGARAVIFANNDDIGATADALSNGGVEVAEVVDGREGWLVKRALGRRGLRGVELSDGKRIACDLLCVSGGWDPAVHLSSQTGVKPVWDADSFCLVPGEPRQAEVSAGACAGRFTTENALRDGAEAGRAAAAACGFDDKAPDQPAVEEPAAGNLQPIWTVPGKAKRIFLDFQHDVSLADIKLATREGYTSVEHLKRYTTLGMATDQGKVGNVVGLAMLAEERGVPIAEVGTTTFRPPYTPTTLGAFAGYNRQQHFQPVRRTPLHDWAERRGAIYVEAGPWLRSRAFLQPGEDLFAASIREAKATRDGVGLCDVSTLGKIDIQGPDAVELLNRVYCNGWKRLPVGKARYGLMLREDGIVFDDGTTSRLGERHYLMTTTTTHAGPVMAHLEYCHQVLWPELDVQMVSVTDQWAGLAIAGPYARKVLEKVLPDEDLSNEGFPFLAAREMELQGIPARLFRISFSGELGFELNVPADYGPAVADLLMRAGAEYNIVPYGLEALDIMRIEKGHVTGAELHGRTTAADVGLGRMMSTKKDYIGRRMVERPGIAAPERPSLVGLVPADGTSPLHGGAHLLPRGVPTTAENDEGYITSPAYSPELGHWIALGLLKNGPDRIGETVRMVDLVRGADIPVKVVSPIFVDPEGKRLYA
ncbi:2Fe-2S iron-sulfur cluster-binding protein [Ferruginivarius sediminum]|uniref:FAD-dependent oxidoreductase n=1 Tax=Ferruginivarius sediminum TaxID=2661937 RepID=A0A369T9K1_9PROT|nr:2Fe-2S iron-sulfur cluster-binding protein [Ferruginivarius sediminum]RDD61542.1 FAD-dependent oxidoreductase [Ferruginivarius sediminum]